LIGWAFGTGVSVIAMVASAALDLPTGATVVCAFGLTLLALGILVKLGGWRVTGPHALSVTADAMSERSGASR